MKWNPHGSPLSFCARRGAGSHCVFALVFGVLAVAMPGITLAILVMFWGAFALIDGVVALVAGLRIRESGQPLWALIVLGLLGIAAGVIALGWPGLTALTLVFIIGFWAIAIGVLQLVAAFRFRRYIEGEWLHALSGVLSVVFGLAVVLRPGAGAVCVSADQQPAGTGFRQRRVA